jgi:hypothetical protein
VKTNIQKSNPIFAAFLCLVWLMNSLTLISCKKGKEDPFLTLRSRKARLTGTWVLIQGEFHKNGETTLVKDYQISYSNFPDTYKCIWQLEINPGGNFIETIRFIERNNDLPIHENTSFGQWAFLKAHEENKEKEIVVFTYRIEKPVEGFVPGSNTDSIKFEYPEQRSKLIGLHNNKLHMQYDKSDFYDSATLQFERIKHGRSLGLGSLFY